MRSVELVRGPVRKQSMDPVRSGGPRTGGQSFRVTLLYMPTYFMCSELSYCLIHFQYIE